MMGPTEPLATGVIAYNGDSERGWNDPPTLSFNAVGSLKKGPKLDLRKRVSHQEALTGQRVTSPVPMNSSNLIQGNPSLNGFSSLSLNHQSPSQVPANLGTLPVVQDTNTPSLIPDSHNLIPGHYPKPPCNTITGPPTTISAHSSVPPPKIFSPVQVNPSVIHPAISSTPLASNLGQPLFSFPQGVNMPPVSSVLDTSHVRSNPVISPEMALDSSNKVNIHNSVAPPAPLIFTPSPSIGANIAPSPLSNVGKRSPILERAYLNSNSPNIYTPPLNDSGRNSPVASLPPHLDGSPISTPPMVRSASSSPRSQTPDNGCHSEQTSRHNSEQFDSAELLKATVEAIEDIILKCSDILQAREKEDVRKKVGIMKQLWENGKISLSVQISMKLLTKSLLDGETDSAQKLHVKLMVDYVGEVKQWMVAIKRLISAVGNLS